jgi:chemotaxis protein MotB
MGLARPICCFSRRRESCASAFGTYADFITLLFAFFVVMYSAAQLDKRRAGQLATAIQTAFLQYGSLPAEPEDVGGLLANGVPSDLPVGNTENDEFSLLLRKVEQALAVEIASGDVAVHRTTEGLVISLREVGFFDSGSAEIRASSQPAFHRLAEVLRRADNDIRVEGHTDMCPFTTRGSARTGTFRPPEPPRPCAC